MEMLAPTRQPAVNSRKPAVTNRFGTPGGYRLIRWLGEGGMGTVYLGYHPARRRLAAVKILAEHLQTDRTFVDRFLHEAATGRAIDHPNVVRTLDAGRDPGTGHYFMVLEYVDGSNAQALLEKHGPLPVPFVVRLGHDIASALEHLHARNYVHRDVKPDNILIGRNGPAKLADFGLVKHLDKPTELTVSPSGFGTSWYMPYEQARNASFVDGRSDIFALGVTLYHLLTGTVPFAGSDPKEVLAKKEAGTYVPAGRIIDDVPPELERVLQRMLARDPRRRFAHAGALIQALEMTGLAAERLDLDSLDRVRTGAISAAEATRPDLAAAAGPDSAIWYVRYRKPGGDWTQQRATAGQLIRGLRAGSWPADLEAARSDARGFRPVREYAEFADHAPAAVSSVRRWRDQAHRLVVGTGFGVGLLCAALTASIWRALAHCESDCPLRTALDSVVSIYHAIW